jgi:hypothetical protein
VTKTQSRRNDLSAPVPKFCFELEVDRRTPERRVRTPEEFLAHYFPHDDKTSTDRIFKFMPRDVRGPLLTTWGVRGKRTALRDDDGRVQSVVHDALIANDIDARMFEEGLTPNIIMQWVDLSDWWSFWRRGKITKASILRALESGYQATVFDAEWFLSTLKSSGGKLQGTDVLAAGLSKEDLTEWVRNIHALGDGTPRGIVGAIGWEKIVAKTADDVLLAVLDAMALKVSLVAPLETKAVASPSADVEPGPVTGSREQILDNAEAVVSFKDDELIPVGDWQGMIEVEEEEPEDTKKRIFGDIVTPQPAKRPSSGSSKRSTRPPPSGKSANTDRRG